MSSPVNIESIIKKLDSYLSTSDGIRRKNLAVEQIINGGNAQGGGDPGRFRLTISGMKLAAQKFIDILCQEIESSGGSNYAAGQLGNTAISALTQLEYSEPVKLADNLYQIGVSFSGDLSRTSFWEDERGCLENIAALLNSGYSANNFAYGEWEGHTSFPIPSVRERSAAGFIERAIRMYLNSYASEYGVLNIEVDDVYNIRKE